MIFATAGILDKQKNADASALVPESVSILTWIVLAVATALLAARLVIVAYRYRTRPLYGGSRSENTATVTATDTKECAEAETVHDRKP